MATVLKRIIVPGLVAILGAALFALQGDPAQAHAPHADLDFSIGIDIDGDGTNECGTRTGEDATCAIRTGSTFLVTVLLDGLPEDIGRYDGFDIVLSRSGVPPTGFVDAEIWPDCVNEVSNTSRADLIAVGCGVFPNSAYSTFVGAVAQAGFQCPGTEGTAPVALLHGDGMTGLIDEANHTHYEAEGGDEHLTIECGESAPIPVPPPAPTYVLTAFKLYVETLEPMPGWEMTLFAGNSCSGEPIDSGRTDSRGMHDFLLQAAGIYSIREEARPGWTALDGPCQSAVVDDHAFFLPFRGVPDHNGDVNVDASTNAVDTLLTLQLITGLVDTLPDRPQGDVDRDLVVTAVDSSLILQYDAGLLGSLPVGH